MSSEAAVVRRVTLHIRRLRGSERSVSIKVLSGRAVALIARARKGGPRTARPVISIISCPLSGKRREE
eukprot:3333979-Rhodomonas_salina.1